MTYLPLLKTASANKCWGGGWRQIESEVLAKDSKLFLSASLLAPKPQHFPLDTVTASLRVWMAIPQILKGLPHAILTLLPLKSIAYILYYQIYAYNPGWKQVSTVLGISTSSLTLCPLQTSKSNIIYPPKRFMYISGFEPCSPRFNG